MPLASASRGLLAAAGVTLALLLALPAHVQAQAWVPDKGEGTVAAVFQHSFVKNHYNITTRADLGHITTNSLLFDASYGLTDRLAVDFSLPYVVSKYVGTRPHPSDLDNGSYHGMFQDFRFAVRYNLVRGPLVVTPFVGTTVPSHAYEFYAHAAPGRRLRQVQVGTYVAKLLDPVLPGMFIQARYSYGITERALPGLSHNRSHADLEIGYFVRPRFRVFVLGAGQLTHGGMDMPSNWRQIFTPEQQVHHDQIVRDHKLNVGGGASASLTESLDIFGSFVTTKAARNGHELNRGITVGVSWSFRAKRRGDAEVAQGPESTLIRCICQKTAP